MNEDNKALLKVAKSLSTNKPVTKKLVIPRDVQEKPGEKMAEFVAMSEVRKLIDEAIEPFNVISRIEITLKNHGNKLSSNEVTNKSIYKDLASIQSDLKEFSAVDRSIKKLE